MHIVELFTDLEAKVKQIKEDSLTFFTLTEMLGSKGLDTLIMIFAIFLLVPSPPGFTTVLGTPLLILSTQSMLGYKRPVLPKWISKKSISTNIMLKVIYGGTKLANKIKSFSRTRNILLSPITWRRCSKIMRFICSISIVLPIPMGNFLPALGILLMSLGNANEDGLISLIGAIISVAGITISLGVLIGFIIGAEFLSTSIFG